MDATGAVTRAVAEFAAAYPGVGDEVCVGLSGGPDSLALMACAVRAGLRVRALVVDHGLQAGSDAVASEAVDAARRLGAEATVLAVRVGSAGGMEAAARTARYAALDGARAGRPVLLAHTADDQAETVLLGLARGSGTRSIAGMRPWNPPWGRPLLGVRRTQTLAACAELGLRPHHDPHNRDPRFTRVRVRSEVLPLLDDVLHGGVVDALGRTAASLRDDNDALDALADDLYDRAVIGADCDIPGADIPGADIPGVDISELGAAVLDAAVLADAPAALRTRAVRRWLLDVGATEPTYRVIVAVDSLVCDPTSRAQVAIGGDPTARLVATRTGTRLHLTRHPR
ncbi:MAG: tRNA lysidine(34) synthetase TilS [Gordonia sp.]|uniref:tRNA lysidine(34) synthetase TilS n=1 Tax=Gordonia sp. (in: high G+C Gram-positive bacteria) TaxID=84139 RepID=UPI000C5B26AD|nr:tRNA lysidine(34) synthetase TilS [Gordonia sp. (in: high G+C Gram-positive bacteria)]MAU80583.1 tRNA lysidine(34) synthetase TilS [Gordonia sp. (in: high G+C Gram-positive bacteria)]